MRTSSYVLITAAKNEEQYIRKTLDAVVAQTHPPKIWVVVSDGSTDRTDEFIREFAAVYSFIRFIRLDNAGARVFSSQAFAANAGYESVRDEEFDFIGFLDADISFSQTYYEELLSGFEADPRLGVAGGVIVEDHGRGFQRRYGDSTQHVAGAIQFFRRECYDSVGGLIPLRWGGHDAVANAMAKRRGWRVRSFTKLLAFHHRPTGTAGTTVRNARFREGMQDFYMGYHFLFELGKCARRLLEPPYVVGSALRLCGYLKPLVTLRKPIPPADFVQHLRHEQMSKLFHLLEDK